MAKEYHLVWLADDGEQLNIATVVSSNPKDALFNCICQMIVMAPTYFKTEDMVEKNIRKLIKTGAGPREHHFAQIGEQVLSIMEANFHLN